MKVFYAIAIAAAALSSGISAASAQTGGTTRPSYDNPRAYDRDANGNETYMRTNTPNAHSGKHMKKHMQRDDD